MNNEQYDKAIQVVKSCTNMDQLKIAIEYAKLYEKKIMKGTQPSSKERRLACMYASEIQRLIIDKMWREFQP